MEEKTLIIRLPLPVTEMKAQSPLEVKRHFIELHDEHIRWVLEGRFMDAPTDEEGNPDLDRPKEPNNHYFDETYRRFYLVGVAIALFEKDKQWRVELGIRGQDSLKFYFKSKEGCKRIYEVLQSYLLGTLAKANNSQTKSSVETELD